MKLLLTSAGFTNEDLKKAFLNLLDRPTNTLSVVIIPTAKNRNANDKRVFLRTMKFYDEQNFKVIDFVDVAAIEKKYWLPRLKSADVIHVCGGNTYYLLDQIRKSGLDGELKDLLESRIYVGDSAGSILVTPSIDVAMVDEGDENIVGINNTTGLSLVDFEVSPHTPGDVSLNANKEYSASIKNKLYAYDDNTAIKIDGDSFEFVGTGQHWEYN